MNGYEDDGGVNQIEKLEQPLPLVIKTDMAGRFQAVARWLRAMVKGDNRRDLTPSYKYKYDKYDEYDEYAGTDRVYDGPVFNEDQAALNAARRLKVLQFREWSSRKAEPLTLAEQCEITLAKFRAGGPLR